MVRCSSTLGLFMLVRGGEQALVGRTELCASTKRCIIPGHLLLPVIDKYCLSNASGSSLGLQMGALNSVISSVH